MSFREVSIFQERGVKGSPRLLLNKLDISHRKEGVAKFPKFQPCIVSGFFNNEEHTSDILIC